LVKFEVQIYDEVSNWKIEKQTLYLNPTDKEVAT